MASVKVRVDMKPGWEIEVMKYPKLMDALSEHAWAIAGRANAMSSGFRTKVTKNKGVQVGGKQPLYLAKDAIFTGRSSVALTYTGNYAAMKDTHENNTLLKSIN